MSDEQYQAYPMRRVEIREVATKIRVFLARENEPYFPIVRVIETLLDDLASGFTYDILPRAEMGPNHGLTDHQNRKLLIREDVYVGACDGNGRDRATLAHELGHVILHGPARLARRMDAGQRLEAYRSPEWQAKAFAGELLVFHRLVGQCPNHVAAAELFGVSDAAAQYQWQVFKKEGIVK